MAKDPAFLFYSADFLTGTVMMTEQEIGIYISLLCIQHQHGGLIKRDYFESKTRGHPLVREKFEENCDGWFNQRLREESDKRASYCKSRNNNKLGTNQHTAKNAKRSHDLTKTTHMGGHMENEDVNDNIVSMYKDKKYVQSLFDKIWEQYPNKDGRKLAIGYFHRTVRSEGNWIAINTALKNYLGSDKVLRGYVKNGSTWFNNWTDWIKDPVTNLEEEKKLRSKQKDIMKMLNKGAKC